LQNKRVKRETSVGEVANTKVPTAERTQLNALPVAGKKTPKVLHQLSVPLSVSREVGNCPALKKAGDWSGNGLLLIVPVISKTGKPLMPTSSARARELVRKGRALRRFSHGLFYIKLTDRSDGNTKPVACGIDPGSKKEGFTVKSANRTFLNIQADAVTWVKDAVETRRNMRRSRRNRKTPCRANRKNRSRGGLSPSTKARWQWKLRIAGWLANLYPISIFVVEDIKAKSKGKRKWDATFSPLETGKKWFYQELGKIAEVRTKRGYETREMRDALGLKKTSSKLAEVFEAHCVDSWVLAASAVGGVVPDNTSMLCITPLRFHRRQLHYLQPSKGGNRKPYGSTRSLGFKRGSLIKHLKHGVCYVGGTMGDRISLHSLKNGERISQKIKPSDCKFLSYLSWRTRFFPGLKSRVSRRVMFS